MKTRMVTFLFLALVGGREGLTKWALANGFADASLSRVRASCSSSASSSIRALAVTTAAASSESLRVVLA